MKLYLDWVYLGLQPYRPLLQWQRNYLRLLAEGAARPLLVLLQHQPVVTLGRRAEPGQLLVSSEQLRRLGIAVVDVERGGGATYHGPGQLVGYPLVDIRRYRLGVRAWVESNARALQEVLRQLGVTAAWSELHPGLWVGNRKLAALGFHISRGLSSHGFALNVDIDLGPFELIVPCGLAHRGVTSLRRLGVRADAESLAAPVAQALASQLGVRPGRRLELDQIPALGSREVACGG